jgi:UPF0755 protein
MSSALTSVVIGVLLAGVLAGAGWVIGSSPRAIPKQGASVSIAADDEPIFIVVEAGDTAASIAERLESAGIIESASSFRLLARITGAERALAAGEYEFQPGTSVLDAVTRIRKGLTSARIVAVPEGLRLEEIAALLERRGIVSASDFLATAAAYRGPNDGEVLELLDSRTPGLSLEGYIFPATYSFSRRATPHEIVEAMVKALDERLTPDLRVEARQRGLTLHEVLTLASIVEREVLVPDERRTIASVFLNRLQLGMPLQADPTVQYAASLVPGSVDRFGYWKRELTVQDLEFDSPYNTYTRPGLPPGPIASPGMESILAVIRPAETPYLYFVARPDGSHAFSTTFEEHEQNVERYQR